MDDRNIQAEFKQHEKDSAKREIAHLEAMKLLINNDNDCCAVLEIDGTITCSFSRSNIFIKVINWEIKEIIKY